MPYIFDNSTVLNYSLKKEYLGEGLAPLNGTKSLTLKGFIDNRNLNLDNEGVKENFNQINQLLNANSGQIEQIIINGIEFGTGKVISVKFPKENPIRFGEFEYDIEIYEQTDLNFYGGDRYGTYLPSFSGLFEDITEQIDFNYTNGKYSYNHDFSLEFKEMSGVDYGAKAKALASGVFSDNLLLGLCGKFSGYFNTLKNKKSKFKETYDDINLKYSFNKIIEIDENYNGENYSNNYTYTLALDPIGRISVSEKGQIYSLSSENNFDASGIMENEIILSQQRCANIYESYKSNNNSLLGAANSLYSKPILINRNLHKNRNYCEYTVQYINDTKYVDNLSISYSSEHSSSQDLEDINYNLDIFKIGKIDSFSHADYSNIKNLINLYTGGVQKIKNFTLNYETNNAYTGNYFQCSFTATNDPFFNPLDNDFRYFKVERNIIIKPDMYNTYQIPNKGSVKIYPGGQKNLSEQNVTINGILVRPNGGGVPIVPLQRTKEYLVELGLKNITTNSYIEPAIIKYNSNYEFAASMKVFSLDIGASQGQTSIRRIT